MTEMDIKGVAAGARARAMALRDRVRLGTKATPVTEPATDSVAPSVSEAAKAAPAAPQDRAGALSAVLPAAGAALAGLKVQATGRLAFLRSALPGAAPAAAMPRSATGIRGLARNAGLGVAVLGVAVAAGQFVQKDGASPVQMGSAALPREIVALAAPAVAARSAAEVSMPDELPVPEAPKPVEVALTTEVPGSDLPVPDAAPMDVTTVAAPICETSLVGMKGADASIDIVLLATCAPDAPVVLRHGGLALSARTSASGALFLSVPALEPSGRVILRLEDGTELETEVPTDLTGLRRFAVQWQSDDRMQLHALEGTSRHGEAGHVWAEAARAGAGRLAVLGDASVAVPLLAEVYTFPADPVLPVALTVEAEVTGTTCARDILGEILHSDAGTVTTMDVTLVMPGCDAVGDFLVLNNLLPETTLASVAAN